MLRTLVCGCWGSGTTNGGESSSEGVKLGGECASGELLDDPVVIAAGDGKTYASRSRDSIDDRNAPPIISLEGSSASSLKICMRGLGGSRGGESGRVLK